MQNKDFWEKVRIDAVSALREAGVPISKDLEQTLRSEQELYRHMSNKQLEDRITKKTKGVGPFGI